MNRVAQSLACFQADFRAWLVEADAVAGQRLGDPAGLAVYQNNYRVALVTSLEASFPRLQSWLGPDAFAAAAARYADACPPHSWTLDAFGAQLPQLLAHLYPEDPDVVELARIDWAVGQAFVAADMVPMAAGALGGVDWDRAVLRFAPSLHRLEIVSNADALWLALASGEVPPALSIAGQPTLLLVWRQGFETVQRRCEGTEAQLLAGAVAGTRFAALCAELAATLGDEAAVTAAGEALGRWIADGLIAGID